MRPLSQIAGWIGHSSPYGLQWGNAERELVKVAPDVQVALMDDLVFRRSDSRFDFLSYRFSFPYRNPSLVQNVDFRGMAWLRGNGRRLDVSEWQAAVRSALLSGAPVHRLANPVRVIYREKQAYELRPIEASKKSAAKSLRICVCYRDRSDLTLPLIEDLALQTFSAEKVELAFVNNQSKPEEVARVREAASRLKAPWSVEFIDYNLPYNHSAQNNLGLGGSSAEVFVFLNNDARLTNPTTLQQLADYALMPGVASAGPRIVGKAGQVVSSGMQLFTKSDAVGLCESECEIYSNVVRETTGNSFASAAVSAEVFKKVGPLDEAAFPTQYNDADFALRALKLGYRHLLVGSVDIFHQPGQTDTKRSKEVVTQTYRSLLDRHGDLSAFLHVDPTWRREKSLEQFLPRGLARAYRLLRKIPNLRNVAGRA